MTRPHRDGPKCGPKVHCPTFLRAATIRSGACSGSRRADGVPTEEVDARELRVGPGPEPGGRRIGAGGDAGLADPRRAVLLLHRRPDVADPRRLHVLRGRYRAPQEPDDDGDEEHPHDRRRDADVLLLRLVDLRLRAARPADRAELERLRRDPVPVRRSRGATRSGRTSRTTSTSSSSWPSCCSRGRRPRSCRARSSSARGSPRTWCSRACSARSCGSSTRPGAGAPAAG